MSATQTQSCQKCGQPLAVNAKFCVSCGTSTSGIFSGGGSSTVEVQQGQSQDTLFPILQEETLGDYDLYGELGRGGMAAVYLALDLALNRKVAVKTMLPELVSREGMVQRFKREAQTAAALSHPHIVQIFSVKETKRLVFFVMKYIEGRSLESVIVERGQLNVDLTRVILAQAGSALAFANRKGVVHRDVKPANIMLEEDGWAIVTDFGIAKVQEAQNLTATGTAIGTPHYMSPEQFHNKAVTGASDQYSFGVVAYEMLTGKKPFDGGSYAEIITQHLFDPPPDVRLIRPDVPASVAEAITKMLSKDAKDRFADIDVAVAALGMPSQTQVETGRTQMASIAAAGREKRASMAVPLSPVPIGKRTVAGTVIEPSQTPRRSSQAIKKKSSRVGMWVGIAAAAVVLIGGGAFFLQQIKQIVQGNVAQRPTHADSVKASASTGSVAVASPPVVVPSAPTASTPGVVPPVDSHKTAGGRGASTDANSKKAAQPPIKAPSKPATGAATSSETDAKPPKTAPVKPAENASATKASSKDSAAAAASNVDPPPPPPMRNPAQMISAPLVEKPAAPPPGTGFLRGGSTGPDQELYINGVKAKEPFTSVISTFKAPVGDVNITIKGPNCVDFNMTVRVGPDSTSTFGRKVLTCK